MKIQFTVRDKRLTTEEYIGLLQRRWPKLNLDPKGVDYALERTLNITVRHNGELIGITRVLSDGYMAGHIAEITIERKYDDPELVRRLLEVAFDHSPTGLTFCMQAIPPDIMKELGWTQGSMSYIKRKGTPQRDQEEA